MKRLTIISVIIGIMCAAIIVINTINKGDALITTLSVAIGVASGLIIFVLKGIIDDLEGVQCEIIKIQKENKNNKG